MSTSHAFAISSAPRPTLRFVRLEPPRPSKRRKRVTRRALPEPARQLTLLGVPMEPTPDGIARVAEMRARRLAWERERRAQRERAARERERVQLEVELPIGVRASRKARLARIGRDPRPDAPWSETVPRVRRFAELFPDGMSFAEIGHVLGCRKQQAFKLYTRALRKLEAATEGDEALREALDGEETRSTWDAMMGTA